MTIPSTPATTDAGALADVTDEMLVAAMRAFEPMSSVLRYREKDKWHSCDMIGMRDAIRAALTVAARNSAPQETRGDEPVAWLYDTWCGLDMWSKHFSFDKPSGNKWQRNIVALYAALQQSPRLGREGIVEILAKHVKLDWLNASDGHPDIVGLDAAADAILAFLSPDTTVVSSNLRGEVK